VASFTSGAGEAARGRAASVRGWPPFGGGKEVARSTNCGTSYGLQTYGQPQRRLVMARGMPGTEERGDIMRSTRLLLAIGVATSLTLSALAQTALKTDNAKVTNTIGGQGADTAFNGKGNATFDSATGVWEVNGGGEGLWTSAEGITLVTTTLEGDGNVTARLLDEKGGSGDGWMRSGVMIRAGDDADDAVAAIFTANEDSTTPRGRHIHSHWRYSKGSDQVWAGDTGPYAPEGFRPPTDGGIGLRYFPLYLRAQRRGNVAMCLRSDDGKLWEQCTQEQSLELSATARAGIFVSSNGGETFGTTHFDNVATGKELLRAGPFLTLATAGDGAVLLNWTGAPGADRYNVYRRLDGEKEFTKLTAEPTKQTFFTDTAAPNGKVARYIVTGLVGNEETAGALQAVASPSPPIVIGKGQFFNQNVDIKSLASTQVTGDGQLVITAAGSGFSDADWRGAFDGFRFVAAQMDGNFTLTGQITAKVTSDQDRNVEEGKHQNGGVGLMVREGLSPSARFGMIFATLGNGVQFRGRTAAAAAADVSEDGTDDDNTKYPLYLRIQRTGDVIKGFQSADGKTFTQVGGDLTLSGLNGPVYVGFAVTNGFEGFNMTARIDAKSITLE
jgi:hypothetical protein